MPPLHLLRKDCSVEGGAGVAPISVAPKHRIDMCMYIVIILYLGHWMRFEYDEQKNEYNLARHGVDFPTAARSSMTHTL